MLEWASREPGLVLAFAYILYMWLYEFIRGRDARRRYRHSQRYANRALPVGATQAPAYRPNAVTRFAHASHAAITAVMVAGIVYYIGRSILAV